MSKIPIKYSERWQKELNQQNSQTSLAKHVQNQISYSNNQLSQKQISFKGIQAFHQIVKKQVLQILMKYQVKDQGVYNKKSVHMFLYDILELQNNSIDFIMKEFLFLSNTAQNTKVQLDMILKVIFQVQFISVVNNMIIKEKQIRTESDPSLVHIEKENLVRLLDQNCFFLKQKPSKQILEQIYDQINQQNGNKNYILVLEYKNFMNSHLCQKYNRRIFTPKKTKNYIQKYSSPNKKYENSIQEVDQQSQMGKSNQNHISKQSFDQQKVSSSNQPVIYLQNHQQLQKSVQNDHSKLQQKNNQQYQNEKIKPQLEESHESVQRLQEQSKLGLISNYKNQLNLQPQQQRISRIIFLTSDQFIRYLWNRLKRIFQEYSIGTNLQIKYDNSIEIISQLTSDNEVIVYISQGLHKLSSGQKHLIKFQKFAAFVLHSLGEMSLKQFNLNQIKGKFQLNEDQLAYILKVAYENLFTQKQQANFSQISTLIAKQQIKTKSNFTYRDYMMWLCQKMSHCPKQLDK